MRKIKRAGGLKISIGFAGTEGEGLTTVGIDIPIDGNKHLDGVNIIDCIRARLLPLLSIDAIAQTFTPEELDLIASSLMTTAGDAVGHLLTDDDASLGKITFAKTTPPENTPPEDTPLDEPI